MRDAIAPSHSHTLSHSIGAKDGIRTRDPDLGKVVLYQLSYFRSYLALPAKWSAKIGSDFTFSILS